MNLLKSKAAVAGKLGLAAAAFAKEGATTVASAASAEALKNERIAEAVEKHGSKLADAKDFVVSSVAGVFAPSPELQAFVKNPSPEAFMAHPELLFHLLALLSNMRHPKTALIQGLIAQGMAKAAQSTFVEDGQKNAAEAAVNSAVREASGGVVGAVPPEVTACALNWAKNNPKDLMQVVKLAATLR
ncbi:unnamed protein product [Polarella glacialis]|uniref:Uncharacterized protein n=1 Tax=Polarella glacialis TaxID=89957 RepID=A0A813G507_POLGL|nr:unnamed protein product [Polarella glacialis]